MAFDICTICQHQDNKGKCTKPGYCCDTSEDFIFKPVYAAAPEMFEALKAVIAWWEIHQYDTTGDHGEYNIYDVEPDFVTMAKKILEGRTE